MASIYDDPIVDDLERFQNTYIMAPELWDKFTLQSLKDVDFSKWAVVKLMNDDGTEFSELVNQIPTECGGIYVYSIEPSIIPGCGSFIMYVGMASKSSHENLRNRVKSYRKEVGASFTRDRIHRLFSKWGKYIYVHYLPINSTKETIIEVETRLIGALVPPCNAEIRARGVKEAVRAFR